MIVERFVKMGSAVSCNSRADILKSPCIAVMFLKPNYIEYPQRSVIINVGSYDVQHISQTVLNNQVLEDDLKNKIILTLSHKDMEQYHLERMRDIHFIDCNCNCLLKITNDSSDSSNVSDKLFTINVSTLKYLQWLVVFKKKIVAITYFQKNHYIIK